MSYLVNSIKAPYGSILGNLHVVMSESDLPAPVSGEITLEAGKNYQFTDGLTLTNTLIFPAGECIITGSGKVLVTLTTQTYFIKCTNMDINTNINIRQLQMIDTTGTKTWCNLDGTSTPGYGYIYIHNSRVVDFATLGTISENYQIGGLRWFLSGFINFTSGFNFNITPVDSIIEGCGFAPYADNSTLDSIKLNSGNWLSFSILNCLFFGFNTNQYCVNIVNTLTSPFSVTLANYNPALCGCHFFNPAGLIHSADNVSSELNTYILPSATSGEFLTNTLSSTTINIADVTTIVNFAAVTAKNNQKMTTTAAGFISYDGLNPVNLSLDGNVNMEPDGGVNKTLRCEFAHYKNQTTVTFTNATNVVNLTANEFVNTDQVSFYNTAGTLPAELYDDIIYYIVNKATDTFQVSYTSGGAAITFTDDGTPTNSCWYTKILGNRTSSEIDAGSPINVSPKALVNGIMNGCKFTLCCTSPDLLDVDINSAYIRINKT